MLGELSDRKMGNISRAFVRRSMGIGKGRDEYDEREIDKMTLAEAKRYLSEGHFLAGSMGPKVKACIRFLEWGGKRAVITSLDKAIDALEGKTGTEIVKG